MAKTPSTLDKLDVRVSRGNVLGIDVYRGYLPLCDLARISRADIYDQRTNPTGTQRDLSPKHARDAYEYVRTHELAFWPEVFLCVRDKSVLKFAKETKEGDVGSLTINVAKAEKSRKIAISRVDGNHRLHFADGKHEGFPSIDRVVSFCIAYQLTLEEEITLFRDINDNQRRMNTSHLDNIQIRLTPEEQLRRDEPELYIANNLGRRDDSPLHELVYEGGVRIPGTVIPLRTLRTGIEYMCSRPTKLTALNDPDAQYKVIRNYFGAVRKWLPEAWKQPKRYILLRGAGLWGICFIGADVIDRTLSQGKFGVDDMLKILKSGTEWDWSNKGSFAGYSGRGGAVKIMEQVVAEFQDESGISIRSLFRQIMDE